MKFRSIITFSHHLRTNAIFSLIFLIFSSFQTLISSVRIQPKEDVKAIWSLQQTFITCMPDPALSGGFVKWYKNGNQVDDQKGPVYQQEIGGSVKLFFINASKKFSGEYECRQILNGKVVSSDKFELKVYNTIDMEGNKETLVGVEGGSFTILCHSKFDSDSTEAQVSWNHKNHQIRDNDGGFRVHNRVEQSVNQKSVKSTLTIKNLSKDHEGFYTCQSVYANQYLTDMKSIDINLRVQFKPIFPPNTQKNVWIDETTSPPIVVNITCIVNADPIAEFSWFTGRDVPVERTGQNIYSVQNTENLSVLSVKYNDINDWRNKFSDPEGKHRRFQCKARNTFGETKMTFEVNVGKLPETPILSNYSYDHGVLIMTVNETKVEPPIDIYKVEISNNHDIYFNASNRTHGTDKQNTYEIEVEVPEGEHKLKIYAHNPVGWSLWTGIDPPLPLTVASSANLLNSMTSLMIVLALSLGKAF